MVPMPLMVAEVWFWPRIWSILVTILGVLGKERVLCYCCGVFYHTATSHWLNMLFSSSVFLLILHLIILSVACGEWRLWSPRIQLWICLFPFQVYHVCSKDLEAGFFGVVTPGMLMSPWWANLFIIMCCLYLSPVIVFCIFLWSLFWYYLYFVVVVVVNVCMGFPPPPLSLST